MKERKIVIWNILKVASGDGDVSVLDNYYVNIQLTFRIERYGLRKKWGFNQQPTHLEQTKTKYELNEVNQYINFYMYQYLNIHT